MNSTQTTIRSEDVLIRTQETPNPYAIKFVVNSALKTEGKATFAAPAEAEGLPLIYDVFLVDGVRQVHLFQNTMTVTHTGELEESDLIDQVSLVLRTRLPIHNPDFGQESAPKVIPTKDRSSLSPELRQIEEILDRTIRPGLQADGGDVEVMGLENNELKILYQGACGGCPSSMMGTLDAIQSIVRHETGNEAIQVIPV